MFTKAELKRLNTLIDAANPSDELAIIARKIARELEARKSKSSDLQLCDDERLALTQELYAFAS